MLIIDIPAIETYDEDTNTFGSIPGKRLFLEHSLVSISIWESKYKRPFLNERNQLSPEEMLDYICMMCIPRIFDATELMGLTKSNLEAIRTYIEDRPTATALPKQSGASNRETITSELIYTWMVQEQIPFTPCETWNIQRLLTLINYVALKNQPPKKMSRAETMKQHAALTYARRAQHGKPHIPKH